MNPKVTSVRANLATGDEVHVPPYSHSSLYSVVWLLSLSLSFCIEYFYFLSLKVSDGAANQIRFSHAGY